MPSPFSLVLGLCAADVRQQGKLQFYFWNRFSYFPYLYFPPVFFNN